MMGMVMSDFDYTISLSEINTYRQCEMKHDYKYKQKLVPKEKGMSLLFGSLIHDMIEYWAKGKDWKGAINKHKKQIKRTVFEEEYALYSKLFEDAALIMENYLRVWKKDKLKYLKIEEMLGPVTLLKEPKIGFIFRLDALVEDQEGRKWLLERKTHAKFPDSIDRVFDLQTSLYIWALRKLGIEVSGILWDEVRQKAPVKPSVLKSGELTKKKNIDTNFYTYKKAIKEHGLNISDYKDTLNNLKGRDSNFFRRQYHPVRENILNMLVKDAKSTAKEIVLAKRNRSVMETGFGCRFCDYKAICRTILAGSDPKFLIKSEFTTRR